MNVSIATSDCALASGSVASERMADYCSPAPCGVYRRVSMHCTHHLSSPGSPPWTDAHYCSVISAPAQPSSLSVRVPLSCLLSSSCPPFPVLPLCPLSSCCLDFLLSFSHTIHPSLSVSNPLWFVHAHAHACTLPSSFAHTAFVTQAGIHLTLILSLCLFLPPSLPLVSRIQQGGAEPLWCCCCCRAHTHSKYMMGYLRGGK